MTNRADVIVLADHVQAQRKRARRFWGTMGVVLRFEDHRTRRTEARLGGMEGAVRKTAFETRAPRSR